MQQQTHSLCQEPFWIRSSANMFNNRSPLLSSVFEVWLSFRFSSKTCHCFVVFLCGLASFQKKSCRSQLFFLFFCQGFCSSKTYFSGTTLMRPSHRFHGDSHKTVKFPVFQKILWWGCSPTVRDTFSKSMSFLSKVNLSFLVNSASLWILFYQNTQLHCVEECQRNDCWINKIYKQLSRI